MALHRPTAKSSELSGFFMELTARQQLTIKHLTDFKGITTSNEIVKYCKFKLSQPRRKNHPVDRSHRVPGRPHSKKYYQEIINYFSTR